jgi:uncharacterized membrane protein
MTAATAGYLAFIYPSLPRGLPVQYVMGRPFIFEVKSPRVVMLPVLIQVGLLIIFGSVMLLLLWRAKPASGVPRREQSPVARMDVAAEGIALLAAIWIAIQVLGAVRLIVLWRGAWGGFGRMYSLAVIAGIAVSIVVMVRTQRLVGHQTSTSAVDNPAVWRLRHLYFDPGDPALFVQTRSGAGWTLNFGRPLAIVLLAVTLLIGVGGPLVLARYILHGATWL